MGACDGYSGVLLQAYLAAHLEQMEAEIWKFSPSREADACFKGESMNPGWRELDKRNCTQQSGAGRGGPVRRGVLRATNWQAAAGRPAWVGKSRQCQGTSPVQNPAAATVSGGRPVSSADAACHTSPQPPCGTVTFRSWEWQPDCTGGNA